MKYEGTIYFKRAPLSLPISEMSWRTFKFFESEEAKDPDTEQPFDKLRDVPVTCCSCGRGQVVLGDTVGQVHLMLGHGDFMTFPAYELRVLLVQQLKQRNVFVTVGDDEDLVPIVRVWNAEKVDKMGYPTLASSNKAVIPSGRPQSTVMAFVVHENLNMIAVGFKDGTVVLYRGSILRDHKLHPRIIHSEPAPTVYTGDPVYVTGLGFRQLKQITVLMVSTNKGVYSYLLADNIRKIELDQIGCEHNCSAMTDHSQDHKFVIGRNEAVYFYTPEGRAQCLIFEGEKFLLRWFRGYLITVTIGGRLGATRTPGGQLGSARESMTLSIYDIQNQFVAYQTTFPCRVVDVVSEWGSIYALLKDGRLMKFDEVDTKTKLETLFKKNLYPIAINLAKSQSYSDGLIDIFTQYGDHLYTKGDYDGAIEQYIMTIGKLEPSYVIRKFLDSQRIHNLTDYLKALHEKGVASADHTTLLLNCYTKLKDIAQLDKFVSEDQTQLTFDKETAIKVCRQANYNTHALALAKKYHQHDWYIRIQLEDLKDHKSALDYISKLPFAEARLSLLKYGKVLMNEVPDEATRLLNTLCTGWPSHTSLPPTVTVSEDPTLQCASPDEFIGVFVSDKTYLMQFLEYQIQSHPTLPDMVYNTLLELYLSESEGCTPEERKLKELKTMKLLRRAEAKYNLDHALVLAQIHDFKAGILYLYEKAGLFQQILLYHMEHKAYDQVMDTCRKHSQRDPNLWVQALSYFSNQPGCKDNVVEVLKQIEALHLMPPLMVVQTLADSEHITLNDIKPYIVRYIQQENEQIAKDEQQIRQYSEDTAKTKAHIKELQTSARVFQVMKCSLCKRGLSLPAVHFLCHHSFHHNCLDDDFDKECPLCARDNRKILDFIQRQEQAPDLDEQFHAQLQRSSDGFGVVAEYFGRGVFNKASSSVEASVGSDPRPSRRSRAK